MSNRTSALPPVTGLPGLVRELRYHEAARQLSGFVLVALIALLCRPTLVLWWVGAPMVLAGTLLRLWASGHVRKNLQLATTGPYSLVRHPLFSGNLLALFGFAVASGSWWSWLAVALVAWTYYPTAIEYEDRKLRDLFGDQWLRWKQETPALIPGLGKGGEAGGRCGVCAVWQTCPISRAVRPFSSWKLSSSYSNPGQ